MRKLRNGKREKRFRSGRQRISPRIWLRRLPRSCERGKRGNSEAAEGLYRKALSIAAEQEAKLWELRAAVSLARLHRDQGHRACKFRSFRQAISVQTGRRFR